MVLHAPCPGAQPRTASVCSSSVGLAEKNVERLEAAYSALHLLAPEVPCCMRVSFSVELEAIPCTCLGFHEAFSQLLVLGGEEHSQA